MRDRRSLTGVGQPDHVLCPEWVGLRDLIRVRAAQVRAGAMELREYSEWVLDASAAYGKHAASCSHPQHQARNSWQDDRVRSVTTQTTGRSDHRGWR